MKRIIGIENELGITTSWGQNEQIKLEIFNFLGNFTQNGSRLYVDRGHPEIATPECTNAYDTVKYNKANERIMEEKEKEINKFFKKDNITCAFIKNNHDYLNSNLLPNASYGCHENYRIPLALSNEELLIKIAPFLASRQIINGTGAIYQNQFFISSRALTIRELSSSSAHSTPTKPMVLFRDTDSHDLPNFRRIQIICGEANMLEWALYLTIGSTLLVLEMIEKKFLKNFLLNDALACFNKISKNPDLTEKYETSLGHLTALEIQKFYLQEAKKLPQDEENGKIIDIWETTLDLFENNKEGLIGKIDWLSKKYLMNQFCKKNKLELNHYKIKMINLQYHFINREKRLAHTCFDKTGQTTKIVSEEEIENAKNNPPTNTRAYVRTKICDLLEELKINIPLTYTVTWDFIYICQYLPNLDTTREIKMRLPDPLDTDLDSAVRYLKNKGLPIK